MFLMFLDQLFIWLHQVSKGNKSIWIFLRILCNMLRIWLHCWLRVVIIIINYLIKLRKSVLLDRQFNFQKLIILWQNWPPNIEVNVLSVECLPTTWWSVCVVLHLLPAPVVIRRKQVIIVGSITTEGQFSWRHRQERFSIWCRADTGGISPCLKITWVECSSKMLRKGRITWWMVLVGSKSRRISCVRELNKK